MVQPPAFCGHCGLIFSSPIYPSAAQNITFTNIGVTCPRCNNDARLLDGVYDAIGSTLRVALTSQAQIEKFEALKTALTLARKAGATPEQVKETIAQHGQEMQPLANAVPLAGKALIAYITLVCTILTTVIAYLTYKQGQKESVTPEEVNRQIEQAFNRQAMASTAHASPARREGTPSRQKRARARKARHK